jgi:hypothetical protein
MQIFKKAVYFGLTNILIIVVLTTSLARPSVLKVLMKEAKSEEYNALILGESHGSTCINPFLLSEKTGEEVFNCSRMANSMLNLYYILKETDASHHYKRVILDLDPMYLQSGHTGVSGCDAELLLKLSGKRLMDYFLDVKWNDNYNETFFDYSVSKDTLKKIPRNLAAKLNKDYWQCNEASVVRSRNVADTVDCYEYVGRGFFSGVKKSGIEWNLEDFNSSEVQEENVDAFAKIADYCKENDIEFICIQSALSPYRLLNENMDDVHDYFQELCSRYHVPFYDMNYLKKEYLDRTDDDYVDLDGHMMGTLADQHTAVLGDILTTSDNEVYFYNDYDEVLEAWKETEGKQ